MYSQPMHEAASAHSSVMNELEHAASSYLRSARHQPVQWHSWGEGAFAAAQAQDKPVLLDIGAVWCHWCHVMDRESYEDSEIAAIINRHFIAVKVDRDERPDVDARYQAAVSSISGQGGWPLTAFLTPDGRPYFGGTYFPRDDRYGRPGFGRILLTMAQVWRERRDDALETASSVMAAIEHNESFSGRGGGASALTLSLVDKIVASAVAQFDPRNGGFGSQPKFPHPAALDLLLEVGVNRNNAQALTAFTTTLEKMAHGGVYDQLAGGFHRYSVDERWVVPHFEKMLYDNTELLRNYAHGFQSPIGGVVREDFLDTAREIIAWLDATMTDREHGGFYASQDADVGLDDDGDYFTWTFDEARAVLDPAELDLAAAYYDIGELGDMHHNPAKNVLHVNHSLTELAAKKGASVESLQALLDSARRKLIAARSKRTTPFIDRTLYTGWNAMAVSAYLEAARVLRMEASRAFALRTLDRLLQEAWDGEAILHHVIAYPESGAPAEKAPGTLDDYAFTVHACIDAWLAEGEMRYYRTALKLADAMIARFYDRAGGAFFDAAVSSAGTGPLGALAARRKPLQDAPTPAGNPTAASALLRLEALSGRDEYRKIAEETLASFAGIVEHFGLYAGSYGLALERLLLDPVQIVIVGSGSAADRLEATAIAGFAVNKTVIRIARSRLAPGGVPEALAETVLQMSAPDAEAWALVCKGRTCLPPITDAEELLEALGSE
ncbi:MAG TPA: thioredoxin domain-containing protein [Terracidiphilus sp.]|nr:thioredoxin domain-containing protein [Terracidiphilus sp.]